MEKEPLAACSERLMRLSQNQRYEESEWALNRYFAILKPSTLLAAFILHLHGFLAHLKYDAWCGGYGVRYAGYDTQCVAHDARSRIYDD